MRTRFQPRAWLAGHPSIGYGLLVATGMGCLALDLALPLGVAAGVPYLLVVLLAGWLGRRGVVLPAAMCVTGLVVAGWVLSPAGGLSWVVATNRALAVAAIWSTAVAIELAIRANSIPDSRQLNLRTIADSMPVMVAALDREQRYRYVNRPYADWVGQPADSILGRHVREILGTAAYRRVEPRMAAALRGEQVSYQVALPMPGGETRDMHARYEPQIDESGAVTGFYALISDLTEQQRNETVALEVARRTQRVTDNVPALICYLDRDLRYQWHNAKYYEWYGLTEDITGQHVSALLGEDAYRKALPRLKLALDGQGVTFQGDRYGADGLWHPLLVTYSPDIAEDGTVEGLYVVGLDITQFGDAEDVLRRNRQSLTIAQELAHLGSWERDFATGELHWSDEAARIFGFAPGTVHPGSVDFMQIVHPDDREEVQEAIRAAVAGEREYLSEHRIVRPEGEIRHVRQQARVLRDAEGAPLRMYGAVHDVTDEWRAHQRLRDAVEAMPAAFYLYDADRRLLMHNGKAREYSPHLAEYLRPGTTWDELVGAAARTGSIAAAVDDPAAWLQERLRQLADPPEFIDQYNPQSGRWFRIYDRRTSEGGYVSVRVDITHAKRREADLAASEKRFRDYAEISADWFWKTDQNHHYRENTEAYHRLSGFRTEELSAKTRFDFRMPDDDPEKWARHREDLDARRPFRDFTYPFLTTSGEVVHVRVSGVPMFDEAGGFLGYRGTASDVTAEMKALQAADQAHTRLIDAIESLPAAFMLYDRDERLVMCNRRAREFFPLHDQAEMLEPGITFGEQVRYSAESGALPRGGLEMEAWIEERVRHFRELGHAGEHSTGDGRWFESIDVATSEGGRVAIRADITERKLAELSLRENQQLLRTIIDTIPGWLAVKDRNRRFVMVNKELADTIGLPADDLVGVQARSRSVYSGEIVDVIQQADLETMESGIPSPAMELAVTHPDGSLGYRLARRVPLRNPQGDIVGVVTTSFDITERKRAELALRENEQLLQTVIDALPLWLIVKDRQGRYLLANQGFAERFGKPAQELIGALAHDNPAYSEEQRRRLMDEDEKVMRSGEPSLGVEREVSNPDGTAGYKLENRVPLRNAQGEVIGLVGVSLDITQHKLAAISLEENQQLLQAVIDALPGWLSVKSADRRFLLVNRELAETFGKSPQEMMGADIDSFTRFAGKSLEAIKEADRRTMASGVAESNMNLAVVLPNGETSYRLARRVPLRNTGGEIVGVVSISTDITGLKRAEDALRASEEKYRGMVESSLQGMLIRRADKPVYANPAALSMLGYDSVEEFTAIDSILEFVHPDERERMKALADARGSSQEATTYYEVRAQRKDGTPLWLTMAVGQVEWEGEPATQGAFLDITERKRAEEEIRRLNASLERRVAERTAELAASHKRFADLYNNTPVMMYAADADGNVLDVNDGLTETLGYAREALISRSALGFVAEEHRARIRALAAADLVSAGTLNNVPLRVLKRSGEALDVLLSVTGERDERGEIVRSYGSMLDVTALHQAEAARSQSEQRYRDLVEASIQGMMVQRDGVILYANQSYADIFGYDSPRELIGVSVRDLEHPEERTRLAGYQQDRQRGGTAPRGYEFRGQRRSGEGIWLENLVHLVEWEGRAAVQTVTIDITERKQAEEALRQSEERYRTIVDTAQEGIWTLDATGRTTFGNRAMADMLGCSLEELLRSADVDFMDEAGKAEAPHRIRQRLTGGRARYDFRWLRKHGGEVWTMVSAAPLTDESGTVTGVLAMVADISERKRAELERDEGRRLLNTLIHALPQAMYIKDREGRYLIVNETMARQHGLTVSEMTSRAIAELPLRTEQEHPALADAFRKVLETGKTVVLEEVETVGAAGVPRWQRMTNAPYRDEAGNVVGIVGLADDITARKEAQAAVASMQEELVRQEKLATLGKLTGTVSHELRNPLATIRTSLFTMRQRLEAENVTAVNGALARAERNVTRCDDIITDLLDFSRGRTLHLRPIVLDEWLTNVVAEQPRPERIAVELDLGAAARIASLDEERFRRVIINLYENAIHAVEALAESDGKRRGMVTVRTRSAGDRLQIEIEDTGCGIPPDVREHIFEPLFSTKSYGVGLGLPTVKQIVEDHEGRIEIDSQVGAGTRIRLILRAAYNEAEAG